MISSKQRQENALVYIFFIFEGKHLTFACLTNQWPYPRLTISDRILIMQRWHQVQIEKFLYRLQKEVFSAIKLTLKVL